MSDRIRIEVSAPEHSGKTSLRVLLARHLEELGAKVILQTDDQLAEKLAKSDEALRARIQGVEIVLTEMRTSR